MIIENTTPLAALTVGDIKELLTELGVSHSGQTAQKSQHPGKRYVYGLKGIQALFGVSHLTAQHYKDGFLKPAVMQQGRKIVVDVEKAVELFKNYKDGNDKQS